MTRWRALIAIYCLIVLAAPGYAADSTELKNKGLYISPLREEVSAKPGEVTRKTLTVANYTDKPADINLSVEQFSVANYSYDYRFEAPPQEDWIKLDQSTLRLQPNQTYKLPYTIQPPVDAPPGGHYFTIFATKQAGESLGAKKLRAGSLVNVTVQGNLIYSNYIQSSSVPWFVYDKQFPVKLDVRNQGNVHFFASPSGRVQSIGYSQAFQSGNHLLFPKTNRLLTGQVASPKLPGIYRLDYGYTSSSFPVVQKTAYFLYAPPWSWAIFALIVIALYKTRRGIRNGITRVAKKIPRPKA